MAQFSLSAHQTRMKGQLRNIIIPQCHKHKCIQPAETLSLGNMDISALLHILGTCPWDRGASGQSC